MRLENIARKLLPSSVIASLRRTRKALIQKRISSMPVLNEEGFIRILSDNLQITTGDTVYIHSSVDQLHLDFPFYRILPLVQKIIGPRGNVLFPSYPNHRISSYEFLLRGNIFDVRKTPSYTGILTEFARRQRLAVRSLHPTKSVCAIGKDAVQITETHQLSPYPYDKGSPYHKLIERNGKIVGLGVSTQYLSFVYCIDDTLKERFPVRVYHPTLFEAQCVNYAGELEIVKTYAHDMRNVVHDIPKYIKTNIRGEACQDLKIDGMKFFRADAIKLFDSMLTLARRGITVYPRSLYVQHGRER